MTKEEKQLLFKTLCAMLPYSIWGLHRGEDLLLDVLDDSGSYMVSGYNAWFNLDIVPFKPYLRPLSSMTEKEYNSISWERCNHVINYSEKRGFQFIEITSFTIEILNWLNEHHFDYRSLIEKGLAIEVTEENNPYK